MAAEKEHAVSLLTTAVALPGAICRAQDRCRMQVPEMQPPGK